jgi:hypothetical protein
LTQAINEKFSARFNEIEKSFEKISWRKSEYDAGFYSSGDWRKWATSAQHLVEITFGSIAIHAKNFADQYEKCNGRDYELAGLLAIFLSAKEDYLAGFATNFELKVSGEIFGDFVDLARQSLSDGHKDVAAVLAAAALEDALKRYARANAIVVDGMMMPEVINALKSKSLIVGAQKSLVDVMPKIRNAALHAEWSKISESEVGSILGFVEQFLLSKFTPD